MQNLVYLQTATILPLTQKLYVNIILYMVDIPWDVMVLEYDIGI